MKNCDCSPLNPVEIADTVNALLASGTTVTIRAVAGPLGALDACGRIRGCDHHAIWDVLDGRPDLDRVLDDGRHYRWEVVA